MILEKQKNAEILVEGEIQESIGMSLDLDSADFLMQMLSKNIYQDPIGSLVREYTSNALDSHRKCGVDDPIIVSFITTNGNYEFSVEDFGCGLSKDEFMSILGKYGKSTKRESKTELGMFGIGAKSGLSYSSTIYFICRKNGIETKFMMYEGEDKNTIDLLYEKETSERNGVKVIVPVQYSDRREFPNRIEEQLPYFEGVYFNVEGIDNDFKIIRNQDFQWSDLCNNSELHICLDNVYYPLDFSKLGINSIYFPVGLRFGLSDGIFPTVNREAIRYTQEAREIILNKIKKVAEYFIEKYNSTITETEDVRNIFEYFKSDNKYIDHFDPSNGKLDVSVFKNYSSILIKKPILKGISKLPVERLFTIRDYLTNEYEIKYWYSNRRFKANKRNWKLDYRETERHMIYKFGLELDRKKQNYLRDLLGSKYCYIVRKDRKFALGPLINTTNTGYNNWINLLELKKYPKNQWRGLIREAQYVKDLIEKDFIDIDKIDIPQEWIDSKKQVRVKSTVKRVKQKLEGEIVCKLARSFDRYVSGRNCTFENTNIKLIDAHKQNYVTIFTVDNEENRDKIQSYFPLVDRKRVKFVLFSERDYKKVQDINVHNWMKFEVFIQGNNKIHRRILTSHVAHDLIERGYKKLLSDSKSRNLIESVNEKLEYLKYYISQYRKGDYPDFLKEMIENEKMHDYVFYSSYKEIKKFAEKLKFVECLIDSISYYNFTEKIWDTIRDLCKYNKFRIDWKHYKTKEKQENVETQLVQE